MPVVGMMVQMVRSGVLGVVVVMRMVVVVAMLTVTRTWWC